MKTEELIRALVLDGSRPVVPIGRALFAALGLGALLSVALFLLILHPRPDIGHALHTLPFDFKLIVVLVVWLAATMLLTETARPIGTLRRRWTLLLGPLLLGAGVIVELFSMPAASWATRLIGHNAIHCLSLIPLLSLPPLACLLAALRRGAPMHPMVAGAIAGLVSGGLAALLYAMSCPDDSPLFVATWYSIAIAGVTGAAAFAGGRLLRW